jgi:hypothetical protein
MRKLKNKEREIINNHTKTLFSCGHDGDTFYMKMTKGPKDIKTLDKLVYTVIVDNNEDKKFDNLDNAFDELMHWINIYYSDNLNKITLQNELGLDNEYDEDCEYDMLLSISKSKEHDDIDNNSVIIKSMIQICKNFGIELYRSKKYEACMENYFG